MYSKLTKHSRSLTFTCFKSNIETLLVSIVDFEQVNVSWVESCQTSFFAKKMTDRSHYLLLQKALSWIFGWVLNTSPIKTTQGRRKTENFKYPPSLKSPTTSNVLIFAKDWTKLQKGWTWYNFA